MKKFMLGTLAVVIFLAFMPLNAQMPEKKIEPVEEPKTEPKEKTDAKKYDIKSVYTKGMTYERTMSMKMNMTIEPDVGFNFDMTTLWKLKNTIIDVKDGMPIELKCEILDAKQEGANPFGGMMPEDPDSVTTTAKDFKGHWLVVKKNADGKFEITKKSEKFPENPELLKNFTDDTSMYFDDNDYPKKGLAVGESYKFDFTDKLKGTDNPFDDMPEGVKLNDFKVKFDKVEEKDGVILGYFSGKMDQELPIEETTAKIQIVTKMVHDITNNRSLKMDVSAIITASEQGQSFKVTVGATIENKFTKEAKKEEPKIAPKGDEEEE